MQTARTTSRVAIFLVLACAACQDPVDSSTTAHPLDEYGGRTLTSALHHAEPDRTFSSWPVAQVVLNNQGLKRCTGFMIGPRILATSATCAPVSRVDAVFSARLESSGTVQSRVVGGLAFEAKARCDQLMTHHLIPSDPGNRFSGHDGRHNSDLKLFYCRNLDGHPLPPGRVFGYLDFDVRPNPVLQYVGAFQHGFELYDGATYTPENAGHRFTVFDSQVETANWKTYLTFEWAQGEGPISQIELGGSGHRSLWGRPSLALAGSPILLEDSRRVAAFRGRMLHETQVTPPPAVGTVNVADQSAGYSYMTASELLNDARLVASGQTNADTVHNILADIVSSEFGLNPFSFTSGFDNGSLDDPTRPNGVLDLQEEVERAAPDDRRSTYVFDFGSRRQGAQWDLVQMSATPNAAERVRIDPDDELQWYGGKGPVRGRLVQDAPPEVDTSNPGAIPTIAVRERLGLDPSRRYRVAVEAEYGPQASSGMTEIEVDLGGTASRLTFTRDAVLSTVLQPGGAPQVRLKAWGDTVRIRSVVLLEEDGTVGFDTQEERSLWRDHQGRHAVFMPQPSSTPDWALDVRRDEAAYSDRLGLLGDHDYRLCFQATLPAGMQVNLQVLDPLAGVTLSSYTASNDGRHCHDFTTGTTTRIQFGAIGTGDVGAQIDDLVIEDAQGLPVPIDVIDVSGFISPPEIAPYYRCNDPSEPGGSEVALSGLVPGATVELEGELDGQPFSDGFVANEDRATFALPAAFRLATDHMNARQSLNGTVWSAWTHGGSPEDVSFAGRPQAYWTPFYECGARAGVSNFTRGAEVWMTVGGVEYGRRGSVAYHAVEFQGGPFALDDEVRGHASFCGHVADEPMPALVIEHPANTPLGALTVDPVYVQQRRVSIRGIRNGATIHVVDATSNQVVATGASASSETGLWMVAPATAGMRLYAQQSFPGCLSWTAVPPAPPPVRPCDELPAPRVAFPFPGNRVVHIIESIPGATIIVVDAANIVIGHQPGPDVRLARPLTPGETIRVTQKVGNCQSDEATAIAVGQTEE